MSGLIWLFACLTIVLLAGLVWAVWMFRVAERERKAWMAENGPHLMGYKPDEKTVWYDRDDLPKDGDDAR